MKQWIIDRYNKGQDKYFLYYDNEYFIKYLHEPEKSRWDEAVLCCVEYIFYSKDIVCYVYKYRLLYMAIAPDPLEYLEQFKD
jgi:hypothetical protein